MMLNKSVLKKQMAKRISEYILKNKTGIITLLIEKQIAILCKLRERIFKKYYFKNYD